MSIRLTALAREMLPWTPGCPGPLARRELLRSAQRFCRLTNIDTTDSGEFTIQADEGELDLNDYIAAGTAAIRATAVHVDDRQLRQTTAQAVQTYGPDPTVAIEGDTRFFYMKNERILRFFPYPFTARTVRLTTATMPTDTATSLSDTLGVQWRDAIVGGALQAICSIPGEPYTSMDHAAMGATKFNTGVVQARIEVNRSNGASIGVEMRPFA